MSVTIVYGKFEWDHAKEDKNKKMHGVEFQTATLAFADPRRVIAVDEAHSEDESRLYCIGKVGERIMTVRFTVRKDRVRIIGAGYWRKGKVVYEKETSRR